jgi:chemotaxis protein MotB
MNIPAHIAARGTRRYITGRQQSTWLITFADMAILMVAFFAVIISFSHINPKDFTSLSDAMGERFGGKKSGNALVAIFPETQPTILPPADLDLPQEQTASIPIHEPAMHNAVGEAVLADLAKQFEPLLANAALQMQQSPQRIVITLGAAGFFQSGSAELDQKAVEALTRMGQIAGTAPIEVTVEGHADSKPVSGGRYRDNWELAAARSATVLKILVETSGLPAGSFKIVSYGASRPAALETDTAMQARNRRVDIEIRYR